MFNYIDTIVLDIILHGKDMNEIAIFVRNLFINLGKPPVQFFHNENSMIKHYVNGYIIFSYDSKVSCIVGDTIRVETGNVS